jgi:hypothetical protein
MLWRGTYIALEHSMGPRHCKITVLSGLGTKKTTCSLLGQVIIKQQDCLNLKEFEVFATLPIIGARAGRRTTFLQLGLSILAGVPDVVSGTSHDRFSPDITGATTRTTGDVERKFMSWV